MTYPFPLAIKLAVPVLRVADVARSIEWYRGALAFVGDPFPPTPRFEFAILRQGQVELTMFTADCAEGRFLRLTLCGSCIVGEVSSTVSSWCTVSFVGCYVSL